VKDLNGVTNLAEPGTTFEKSNSSGHRTREGCPRGECYEFFGGWHRRHCAQPPLQSAQNFDDDGALPGRRRPSCVISFNAGECRPLPVRTSSAAPCNIGEIELASRRISGAMPSSRAFPKREDCLSKAFASAVSARGLWIPRLFFFKKNAQIFARRFSREDFLLNGHQAVGGER